MAMQTFAVVVVCVKLDVLRFRDFPEILHQNVVHAPPFRLVIPKHRVVGVARKAGMSAGHKVVLEMPGRQITPIVDVEASSEIRHDVARKTELR